MEFHPVADIFPMMPKDAFEELKSDIEANGLEVDIVTYKGKILDGRNRAKACDKLGIKARSVEYVGPDDKLLEYVISMNLKRRHLDTSQRAMVGARIATMKHGGDRKSKNFQAGKSALDQSTAAKILTVDPTTLRQAQRVIEKGTKALIKAVEDGEIAVSVAAKLADQPKSVQAEAVADPERAAIIVKQRLRQEHEEELATKIKGLPTKKYGVILADPEWKFAVWSQDTGQDRAASNHYATSTIEEIKARDVPSISADDCVLFLWSTSAMNEQAIQVMNAWGFEYKTHIVWLKDREGTGYWFRNIHELLLVGTRGNIPAPAMGTQWASAFDADAGEHSAKPVIVYDLIELYFPNLPKIELNARGRRNGWDVWGAEAPIDVDA